MQKILLSLATALLKIIVNQVSPILRQELIKLVRSLERRAKETENQWDDGLVYALKKVLAIQ